MIGTTLKRIIRKAQANPHWEWADVVRVVLQEIEHETTDWKGLDET